MGKEIKCTKCSHLLATLFAEPGQRGRLELNKVRTFVEKNALGEDLGWAICPKCRTRTRVDPAFIP